MSSIFASDLASDTFSVRERHASENFSFGLDKFAQGHSTIRSFGPVMITIF